MTMNITEVRLLSVPLENDYKHTLWFQNLESQIAYFASKTKYAGYNFSYQRKDGYIAYPLAYDSLIGVNYVMYKNASHGDKWFFAFITDMKYINDERTNIYIETDVMQTWRFDYTVRPSFVEREHVASDRVGEHLQNENLELGDFICNAYTKSYLGAGSHYIVVGTTQTVTGDQVGGAIYNGIYSGLKYYAFPNTATGANDLGNWLKEYFDSEGAGDAVQCMFLVPMTLINLDDGTNKVATSNDPKVLYINHGTSAENDTNLQLTHNTLEGYTPKNNKLLCYPYRYLMVSNNNGGAVVYNFEDFRDDSGNVINPKFRIESCLTVGCSTRMIPERYKGVVYNHEEGINLGKYPALNWTSDVFTNWITQNSMNVGLSLTQNAVKTVGGAALAPYTAGLSLNHSISGVNAIFNTLAEVHKASLIPPQSKGNINNGDVITASNENDFHFYDMSIRKEFAKIIDDFFDMFGYKINRVKVPDFYHRENYWYTKTIDVNIDGAIPMNDINKIRDCYNQGITFWCNPENIGDYSVSNSITG